MKIKTRNNIKVIQVLLVLMCVLIEILLFAFLPVAWVNTQGAFIYVTAIDMLAQPFLEKVPGIIFKLEQPFLIVLPYLIFTIGLLLYLMMQDGRRKAIAVAIFSLLSCILAFIYGSCIGIRYYQIGDVLSYHNDIWQWFYSLVCLLLLTLLCNVALRNQTTT